MVLDKLIWAQLSLYLVDKIITRWTKDYINQLTTRATANPHMVINMTKNTWQEIFLITPKTTITDSKENIKKCNKG